MLETPTEPAAAADTKEPAPADKAPVAAKEPVVDPQADDGEDEDLPF